MTATMRSAARMVSAHFEALCEKDRWPFFWRITLEGLIVPSLVALILWAVFDVPPRADLQGLGFSKLFVLVVVVAPLFETLLLQALPVAIARRCGLSFLGQVIATLVPFAALHFPSGIATGICAGVLSGFYFAFTYVHWRRTSFSNALWITAGSHAVHNLVLVLTMLYTGDV